MDDKELDLSLDELESNAEKQVQQRNRWQQLATAKTEAEAKVEAEAKARAEAEARASQAEKEKEFYKTFSQLSSKHPEAVNYQDQILERVNRGYDPEEATIAVLNKEGKLGPQTSTFAPVRTPSAEGGSAPTNIAEGDKSLSDMSQNDKLVLLQEMERSGDLQQALRAGINRA